MRRFTGRPRPCPAAFGVVAICALLLAQPAAAAEFERTVPVAKGTTLDLRLYGGTVAVQAWQRGEVRVHATHFSTDEIQVQPGGQAVRVRARARVGQPHAIDLRIDVPAWMAVTIAGTYLDIAISGTQADVNAQTVRGDVRVVGGAGTITLKSIEGQVVLEGGIGRADLTAVSNGVRVTRMRGTLTVQTVSGPVKLNDTECSDINVSTTSGDVSWFAASMAGNGHYAFATHSGDIDIGVSSSASAAVSVRLFDGFFRSALSTGVPNRPGGGKPFSFVLGNGAANLSLETFSGTISLRPVR